MIVWPSPQRCVLPGSGGFTTMAIAAMNPSEKKLEKHISVQSFDNFFESK